MSDWNMWWRIENPKECKCDICGKEFKQGYSFTTDSGNKINACTDCLITKQGEVENFVASKRELDNE